MRKDKVRSCLILSAAIITFACAIFFWGYSAGNQAPPNTPPNIIPTANALRDTDGDLRCQGLPIIESMQPPEKVEIYDEGFGDIFWWSDSIHPIYQDKNWAITYDYSVYSHSNFVIYVWG